MLLLGACGAGGALLAAGCGGSEQDAHEPKATFAVRVVRASFPADQSIARQTAMVLRVRNIGHQTVPNVAVTIDSFAYTSNYSGLSVNKRPIWVVEEGPGAIAARPAESEAISSPGGGQTAYVNTWALGALAPGRTRTFVWHVVPVKGGTHVVHYTVAAGLSGRSRAQFVHGARPTGQFSVDIAPVPPPTHVNPETGQVVTGAYPPASSSDSSTP
jgi:hypothetical protein